MQKTILLAFVFFSSVIICSSQEKGDFRLGLYGQGVSYRGQTLPQYGLIAEYFLSHKVSLNYRYGFGYNTNGDLAGHINPSLIGLAYLAYAGGTSSGEELILSFMIPEGLSYHVYPKEFLEVAPYINPLGSEINLTGSNTFDFSCSFGMNIHVLPVKNMSLSPNLGGILLYRNGEVIPVLGFSFNYNFH